MIQYKLLLAYWHEPAVAGCLIASPCMVDSTDSINDMNSKDNNASHGQVQQTSKLLLSVVY